ncbi:MAG: DUF4159 domain-containing protein [Sedimentisphaerales bacterium]
MTTMNRRNFLKAASRTAAGLVFMSGKLCAVARENSLQQAAQSESDRQLNDLEQYDFIMPRVQFAHIRRPGMGEAPDYWSVRPGGDRNLLHRLDSVIRCKTKPIPRVPDDAFDLQYGKPDQFNAVVSFDDPEEINRYPFLFMTDENEFIFTQTQKNNLREYIRRGGFIFMDDCVVLSGGDFFYQSAYRLLEDVFGRNSVKRVPNEHEIFHNVYDLGSIGLPYMQGFDHGARGVYDGDRLAIFLSSNDIHCGWCDNTCIHFGPIKYEQSLQMGINIIMYAISH